MSEKRRKYAIEMAIEVGPDGPIVEFVRIRSIHNDAVSLMHTLLETSEPATRRKWSKRRKDIEKANAVVRFLLPPKHQP